MRNFKKVVAMTLIAASTASLAACGGSSNGKKTITFAWWGGDSRHTAVQEAVKKFEAAHTDIKVEVQYAAWDGYEEKMATKFASNTQADVNQINWGWIDQYDKNGKLFLDLNEVKDTLDLTQYDQKYLDLCKYEDQIEALPIAITGRIFYWNKETFDQAGIATPTTYQELLDAGKTFKEKLGDEYYPLAINQLDRTILMVFYLESMHGKEWVTNGKLNYTEAEIAEGLNFITELEKNHVIPTMKKLNGDGAATLDANENWIGGKYAGIFEWDSSASKYRAALPEDKQANFVVGDEIKFGASEGGYSKISLAYAISQNTKYPKECAELVNFLLNEEEGVLEVGLELGNPISKSANSILDKAGKLKDNLVIEANNKVVDFVQFAMDPKFENSKLKSSTGAYYKAMENVSYESQTADQAAADLVKAINEVLGA